MNIVWFFLLSKFSVAASQECIYNVLEFGAKGDGTTLDTGAIIKALTFAQMGAGCIVLFPAGPNKDVLPERVYLTGPFNLTADIELHVEEGAEIRFSSNRSLHPIVQDPYTKALRLQPLMWGINASHLKITGYGVINGTGSGWWPYKPSGLTPMPTSQLPPYLFECRNCNDMFITGPTFVDCPFVCIHPLTSNNITIQV